MSFVVKDLSVSYGKFAAVQGFSATFEPGTITALLGPNGAGKSSTLNALSGLVSPAAGSASLGTSQLVPGTARSIAKAGVRLVPEDRALYPTLSVDQHIRLAVPRGQLAAARELAFGWFPALGTLNDRAAGLLSGGEQQMLAVARALLATPAVLLIDELSLGLAPIIVRPLLDTVTAFAAEHSCSVVLVEQHVDLALEFADHAIVLNRGRIVIDEPADQLSEEPQRIADAYLGAPNA